jgi:hypothetical protein
MDMKVHAAELAKAGIFVSGLMLLFGFGSYLATADLATSVTEKQAAPWALLWLAVGGVGLVSLMASIIWLRKSRTRRMDSAR